MDELLDYQVKYEVHTQESDESKGLFRAAIVRVDHRDVRCIENVYEADDLRTLAAIVEEDYPNAGVVCYYPNPHTEKEVVFGDAMSLQEVIEAEFIHRPGRVEAAREYERYLELTGGTI